jgi:hypothetical protein
MTEKSGIAPLFLQISVAAQQDDITCIESAAAVPENNASGTEKFII